MVNLLATTYKRKNVGRKYKGTVLFLKIMQHNVMPRRVSNYYVSPRLRETTAKYVPVQNMCTLLAEVNSQSGDENQVNLIPISVAFPVSWVRD